MRIQTLIFSDFCKDHRDKTEVPDPLAIEDLISCKLNNKRKLARLITQYGDIFFSNISEGTAFLFRVLQRMTLVFNVTDLKYEFFLFCVTIIFTVSIWFSDHITQKGVYDVFNGTTRYVKGTRLTRLM